MCLSAIYWARIPEAYFGNSRQDAAAIGFDDDFIYQQIPLPVADRKMSMRPLLCDEAKCAFAEWKAKPDKVAY
jgi:tRNA(Arg) A34 adenosine deaminase TadA